MFSPRSMSTSMPSVAFSKSFNLLCLITFVLVLPLFCPCPAPVAAPLSCELLIISKFIYSANSLSIFSKIWPAFVLRFLVRTLPISSKLYNSSIFSPTKSCTSFFKLLFCSSNCDCLNYIRLIISLVSLLFFSASRVVALSNLQLSPAISLESLAISSSKSRI